MRDRKKIIGRSVGTTLNPDMLGGGNGKGFAIVISASKPFAKNCVWFNTSKLPPTADEPITPTKLATPAIYIETDGESGGNSGEIYSTPAILGKAILGRTILGKVAILQKLEKPSIYITDEAAKPKLTTPVIRLTTQDDEPITPMKLSAPIIRIETVEDGGGDIPIEPTKLATPTIYLCEENEDEPIVPTPEKLSAPVIYLEVVEEICNHTYTSVITEPTCTERGYTTYTCTHCGDEYIGSYTEALGHSFGEPYHSDEFSTGYGRKCNRCGEPEDMENPIEKLATPVIYLEVQEHIHNYASVVTAPTCIEQGYTTHDCAECGDSYVDSYVAALGHSFGNAYYDISDFPNTGYGHKCERCGLCEDLEAPVVQLETPNIWLETVEDEQPEEPETIKLDTPVIYISNYVLPAPPNFRLYEGSNGLALTSDYTSEIGAIDIYKYVYVFTNTLTGITHKVFASRTISIANYITEPGTYTVYCRIQTSTLEYGEPSETLTFTIE